jgi:hypothetical protein
MAFATATAPDADVGLRGVVHLRRSDARCDGVCGVDREAQVASASGRSRGRRWRSCSAAWSPRRCWRCGSCRCGSSCCGGSGSRRQLRRMRSSSRHAAPAQEDDPRDGSRRRALAAADERRPRARGPAAVPDLRRPWRLARPLGTRTRRRRPRRARAPTQRRGRGQGTARSAVVAVRQPVRRPRRLIAGSAGRRWRVARAWSSAGTESRRAVGAGCCAGGRSTSGPVPSPRSSRRGHALRPPPPALAQARLRTRRRTEGHRGRASGRWLGWAPRASSSRSCDPCSPSGRQRTSISGSLPRSRASVGKRRERRRGWTGRRSPGCVEESPDFCPRKACSDADLIGWTMFRDGHGAWCPAGLCTNACAAARQPPSCGCQLRPESISRRSAAATPVDQPSHDPQSQPQARSSLAARFAPSRLRRQRPRCRCSGPLHHQSLCHLQLHYEDGDPDRVPPVLGPCGSRHWRQRDHGNWAIGLGQSGHASEQVLVPSVQLLMLARVVWMVMHADVHFAEAARRQRRLPVTISPPLQTSMVAGPPRDTRA